MTKTRTIQGAVIGAILVFALSACAKPVYLTQGSGSAASPVAQSEADRAEVAGLYSAHAQEFSTLNDHMQSAIRDFDLPAVAAACSDVTNWANEGLDIPDINVGDADEHWDKAMRLYAKGGQACEQGALNLDNSALEKASSYLRQAGDEIVLATAALGGNG